MINSSKKKVPDTYGGEPPFDQDAYLKLNESAISNNKNDDDLFEVSKAPAQTLKENSTRSPLTALRGGYKKHKSSKRKSSKRKSSKRKSSKRNPTKKKKEY